MAKMFLSSIYKTKAPPIKGLVNQILLWYLQRYNPNYENYDWRRTEGYNNLIRGPDLRQENPISNPSNSYSYGTYGLSNRPDISPPPPPGPPESVLDDETSRSLSYTIYDPVTRQRSIERNCTAKGCCVPKCFAEKGNRVRIDLYLF